MFENIMKIFNKLRRKEEKSIPNSKEAAKERLHLVLMQDRANVSADFLELMKQEIIDVIKKYIDVDEGAIDVRLTNKENEDGTNGAPALYANIPILNIKNDARKIENQENKPEKEEKKQKEEEKSKEEEEEVLEKKEKVNDIKEENKEKEINKSEKQKSDKKEQKKEQNVDKKEKLADKTKENINQEKEEEKE